MELGNTDNAKRHESLEACVKMIMDHTDGDMEKVDELLQLLRTKIENRVEKRRIIIMPSVPTNDQSLQIRTVINESAIPAMGEIRSDISELTEQVRLIEERNANLNKAINKRIRRMIMFIGDKRI